MASRRRPRREGKGGGERSWLSVHHESPHGPQHRPSVALPPVVLAKDAHEGGKERQLAGTGEDGHEAGTLGRSLDPPDADIRVAQGLWSRYGGAPPTDGLVPVQLCPFSRTLGPLSPKRDALGSVHGGAPGAETVKGQLGQPPGVRDALGRSRPQVAPDRGQKGQGHWLVAPQKGPQQWRYVIVKQCACAPHGPGQLCQLVPGQCVQARQVRPCAWGHGCLGRASPPARPAAVARARPGAPYRRGTASLGAGAALADEWPRERGPPRDRPQANAGRQRPCHAALPPSPVALRCPPGYRPARRPLHCRR